MTDAEKIAAFDDLAEAMTNRWHDGSWTWWCPTPAGSNEKPVKTQQEAVADLVAWAKRKAPKQRNKRCATKQTLGLNVMPVADGSQSS